jgi:hypothetical protein
MTPMDSSIRHSSSSHTISRGRREAWACRRTVAAPKVSFSAAMSGVAIGSGRAAATRVMRPRIASCTAAAPALIALIRAGSADAVT